MVDLINKGKYAAILPVNIPIYYYKDPEYSLIRALIENTINEICNLSNKIIFPFCILGNQYVKFTIIDSLDEIWDEYGERDSGYFNFRFCSERLFLKIEISEILLIPIYASEDIIQNDIKLFAKSEKEAHDIEFNFKYQLPADEFKTLINLFIIAVNIAHPGTVSVDEGIITEELNKRILIKTDINDNKFLDTVDYVKTIKWPHIENLSIDLVWNWLINKRDTLLTISNSKLGRAINAFSHLFNYKLTDEMRLFWSLVGVEALYAQSQSGIQEQIRNKTQVFLGKQKDFKRIFAKVYNFRSRLVHGDLDFPGLFSEEYGKKKEEFYSDLEEAVNFSSAILIATIQKMVKLSKNDLEFVYKVVE